MFTLRWQWLLIFVLIVQSISQNSAVFGMYHPGVYGQSGELISSHAKIRTQKNQPEKVATAKAHCHDEMNLASESKLSSNSDLRDPQNAHCACCDDSCTMARCPTLFWGLASQLELPMIETSRELPTERVQQLVNRMRKPPTPPPNLAHS